MESIRDQILVLRAKVVAVERGLRAGTERHFATNRASGKRYLLTTHSPAPSRRHPWTLAQEERRGDLLREISRLEKLLPAHPRLRQVVQARFRPAHPSFGTKALRRRQRGFRPHLGGRKPVSADRLSAASLWDKHSHREIVSPILRDASPEDLREQNFASGRSVLRHLKVEPARPPLRGKPKRKPFFKAHRGILESSRFPFPCALCHKPSCAREKTEKCFHCRKAGG